MEKEQVDVSAVIRDAIQEFVRTQQTKAEPAYKAELHEERKRREQLEHRLNELVEENKRSRAMAEEADRNSAIRAELQRLGVAKVDLAYRAVKDDLYRADDGRLLARTDSGEVGAKEYLSHFVSENPELLPARIPGGSGASGTQRTPQGGNGVDLDKIRPGMSPEELERVRQEISRVAAQTMRGN
jgi:predicted house-cleaning noncanonical NTP pyrophosphatase (MazG superfamily)